MQRLLACATLFVVPAAQSSTLGHFAGGPKGVLQMVALALVLVLVVTALVMLVLVPLKYKHQGALRAVAMTLGAEVLCIGAICAVWFLLLWLSRLS